MVRVLPIQVPSRAPETETYVWQEEAACGSLDPKYFEFQDRDNPSYRPEKGRYNGGKVRVLEVRPSNRVRLTKGQAVCLTCPVAQQCIETADQADVFYTVRGGYLPIVLDYPGPKPKVSLFEWLDTM